MSYKDALAAELGRAQELAKFANERDLTVDEMSEVKTITNKITDIKAKIAAADEGAELLARLGDMGRQVSQEKNDAQEPQAQARDLGEFFAKSGMFDRIKDSNGRFTVGSPEFKNAAADPTLTTGITVPVQYGPTIQTLYRRLTVADLLASGTISGNAITYWTQGTLTGDVTTVAEGGTKPSLNFAFGQTTESLTKLAGVTKVSDEMMTDLEFLVSVIRSQLVQRLALVEEDQLLNGNGTTPNLRGLLNRVGIQTYATSATASPKKWMDGIFHATTMAATNAFVPATGVIVNPADYEYLRLAVDGQSQYYGGGPFTGAYGNGGFQQNPGLWGLQTVVTPAIAAGTALVGDFATAGQVFRKGGVRLESTNSNEDDFKKNLVAMRVEERVALAVYYPAALVKVTLTA